MVRTRFSLLFNHDDLAVLGLVSKRGYAPDPKSLALGGGDLVADALGGDFPLELGKRQQDIERQPPHRGRGRLQHARKRRRGRAQRPRRVRPRQCPRGRFHQRLRPNRPWAQQRLFGQQQRRWEQQREWIDDQPATVAR